MQLQGSVTQSQNEALKAQKEVERLNEELKKLQTDTNDKDEKIKEMTE